MNPIQHPEIRTARDQLHRVLLLVQRSRRHLPKAAILMAVGMATVVGIAFARKPVYISEAVLLYRRAIHPIYLTGAEAEEETSSSDVGLRLREILLARPLLNRLIDEHKLYPNIVKQHGHVSAVDYMRKVIGYRVGGGGTFHISFKGATPELAEAVTADLANSLIREETRLRTEQATATQRFLEAETKRLQQQQRDSERTLAEFLAKHPEFAQEQVSGRGTREVGASVRAAEARRRAVSRRGDATLLALRRQASRLSSQLAQGSQGVRTSPAPELVAAREGAEEELRAAQSELSRKQAAFTEKHPDVVAARTRVRAAIARVNRVSRALDASKAVQRPMTSATRDALRAELANIEAQMASYRSTRTRTEGAAQGELGSSKASQIVALETEWTRLNRRVQEARSRYLRLEAPQFRASLEASPELSGQASHMRIIDPAFRPRRPAGVGRTVIVIGGLAVCCVLACLLLLTLALVDERAYDRSDVDRMGLVPVLVEVPRGAGALAPIDSPTEPVDEPATPDAQSVAALSAAASTDFVPEHFRRTLMVAQRRPTTDLGPRAAPADRPVPIKVQRVEAALHDPRLIMLNAPDSQQAAAFRVLRYRLTERDDPRTITVTSAERGDGKTTAAINLAIALSECGRARVLLLEANLRHPSIAGMLGMTPPQCLTVQLAEHHVQPDPPPWALAQVAAPWLHVLAVDPRTLDGPRLIDGPAFESGLSQLQRVGYDYIVIDTPHVLGNADVNLVQDATDGVVLAMWARKSTTTALRAAIDQLTPTKLLGVTLLDA